MADNKEIKVGTQVLVYGSSMRMEHIERIDGETKTCWKIGGRYYKKDTLLERGSDAWHRTFIRVPSDDEVKRIVRRSRIIRLYNFFGNQAYIERLDDEDLKAVIDIVSKYQNG